ncbi:PadR family transcriptional regulator [Sphingomonas spermidinifaciens]|uniref:PadR family transcriptional regulator n=1 Tax=Sphingomonas spermidinifaciens TaxID=1141889 RepID=A0A2A4B9D6_9SPHN|nr:PadR family transcriptional regulator [Sphingomonas spermidinifaciens]PCD04408.1 PadR family transcriptional regulator [Sphingomonas spermidinifaciens]
MFGRHHHRGSGHGRFAVRGGRHFGPFTVEFDMGEGPRRGGGRRRFDGDELRLILLKLIAEAPRHGYDLIREIEARTGGAYAPSPGVVYPTLTLLDEMGLIAQQASEGAKKLFAVTAEGEALLAAQAEQVEALMARLADLSDARARGEGGPVRRAMHNLKAAVIGRVAQGAEIETLHAITDILDDAARRIERL